MKQHLKYQHGQAIVLIVIGIVGLIGITALAIDGGNAYSDRRHAQNAADTAALSAGLAYVNKQNYTNSALYTASINGYNNDGTNNTVIISIDQSGNSCTSQTGQFVGAHYDLQPAEITVTITSTNKTYFAPIIGIKTLTNKVTAASMTCGTFSGAMYGGNTIVGLAPTGCDAVNFCGSSQLQIWGGGVFSNSSSNCGLRFNGNPQVTLYDGPFKMVAPSYTVQGNPKINSNGGFQGNQPQYPYPPTDLPNPTCTTNGTQSGSTLSPGNYGSASSPQTFPPSGVDTLNPGTYCVYGDFNVNGSNTLRGNGVTIVMETGAIHWNGSSQIQLSGPTSGAYQGLTLFAPISNTSVMVMNGSSNIDLTGTLLMPGASLSFNGASQIQKHPLQWIAKTVQLCGNNDTQLEYSTAGTAKQNSPAIIQLTH